MADLSRISHAVTSNIAEIAIGIRMITKNHQLVADNAEQIGVIGVGLDEAVAVFQIGGLESENFSLTPSKTGCKHI